MLRQSEAKFVKSKHAPPCPRGAAVWSRQWQPAFQARSPNSAPGRGIPCDPTMGQDSQRTRPARQAGAISTPVCDILYPNGITHTQRQSLGPWSVVGLPTRSSRSHPRWSGRAGKGPAMAELTKSQSMKQSVRQLTKKALDTWKITGAKLSRSDTKVSGREDRVSQRLGGLEMASQFFFKAGALPWTTGQTKNISTSPPALAGAGRCPGKGYLFQDPRPAQGKACAK